MKIAFPDWVLPDCISFLLGCCWSGIIQSSVCLNSSIRTTNSFIADITLIDRNCVDILLESFCLFLYFRGVKNKRVVINNIVPTLRGMASWRLGLINLVVAQIVMIIIWLLPCDFWCHRHWYLIKLGLIPWRGGIVLAFILLCGS